MTLKKEDTPSPQSNEPSLAVKLVLHLTAYIPRPKPRLEKLAIAVLPL